MGRLFDDLNDLWTDPALPGEDEPRVLVAVMNDPRALEIARTEGWYRIPIKRAPPRVGADYLAFYQTGAFGPAERWAVNYYAPIRHFRIVRRRDLLPEEADHPRANDEYYKIEVGPLEPLPHRIPSRRLRRITFIPTTLRRLLSAEEINDLWIGSRTQEQLWEILKAHDLPAERQVNASEEEGPYQVDFALYCRDGRVAIQCEGSDFGNLPLVREISAMTDYGLTAAGWTALRIKPDQSPSWLQETLRRIQQTVEQLGGLAA
jgi:very-short-patch-repair endonuclease